MRSLYLCLLLFVACSLKGPRSNPQDNFDKILAIMKTKSTEELIRYYGKPNEISEPEQDKSIQILRYKDSRIDAYVEKSNKKKISH